MLQNIVLIYYLPIALMTSNKTMSLKPHIVAYRDYEHFDIEKFRPDIRNFVSEKSLKCFKETVFCIFNKHAIIKR